LEIVSELPLDQVLLGDCSPMMGMLPPASVHCVFADQHYNLQLRGELRRPDDSSVDRVDEDWDRFIDFDAYDAFTRAWLGECRRVLRKDGTLWVIGAFHSIFRIGSILQDPGFWILNDVIWRKARIRARPRRGPQTRHCQGRKDRSPTEDDAVPDQGGPPPPRRGSAYAGDRAELQCPLTARFRGSRHEVSSRR